MKSLIPNNWTRQTSLSLLPLIALLIVGLIPIITGLTAPITASAHAQVPVQKPADDLGPPPPPAPPVGGVGPSIAFETLSHDWGTILQGTNVEFTYKFRNVGSEILRITNVKPG